MSRTPCRVCERVDAHKRARAEAAQLERTPDPKHRRSSSPPAPAAKASTVVELVVPKLNLSFLKSGPGGATKEGRKATFAASASTDAPLLAADDDGDDEDDSVAVVDPRYAETP